MVNENLEAQKQTIKHYWLNVIHSPKKIQELTNIPLYTHQPKAISITIIAKWLNREILEV